MLGCVSCFKKLGNRLFGKNVHKWQAHLDSYCHTQSQKLGWCSMFIDNYDIILEHSALPKEVQLQIKNTNIASEIIKIIMGHYEQQNNLFRFCVELFGSYLKLKYSDVVNPTKNTLLRISNDYQGFSKLVIDLLVLYYTLQDREIVGSDLFYKLALPSLTTQFLFQNDDVSMTISRVSKLCLKGQIDKIQFHLQKMSNISIQEVKVQGKYRLISEDLQSKSYSGAINIIKEIVRIDNPCEKVKLIQGIPRQLKSSMLHYYKSKGEKLENLQIQGTNLRGILTYIIIQSNQPSLIAHLYIAQMFSSQKQTPNHNGCLQQMIEINEDIEKGVVLKKNASSQEINSMLDFKPSKTMEVSYFDEVSSFEF